MARIGELVKGEDNIIIQSFDGDKLKEMADYRMHVDENDMQIAEDLHMTFDHMMMKIFYMVQRLVEVIKQQKQRML